MSERTKLLERFQAAKKAGKLKDLKFFLAPSTAESTVESVCEEVNYFLDALDAGTATPREWKDSNRVAHS